MDVLDHWHPILPSRLLKRQPVAVRLAGHDLALFRTADGRLGALEEKCPHRRMRLSMGTVVGDKLRCRYHGWTFDCAGAGESPATPKLYAHAQSFAACELHDAVWVRSAASARDFPRFDIAGYYNVCNLHHEVNAPLELVVDNFCEIEHTPTTHAFFGYPLDRMHEVQVEFLPTDTSVRVVNRGPKKPISFLVRALVGIGRDYLFMDDWTTYFSPVHSVYDHWWQHPVTGKESRVRWRLYIFFTPIDAARTAIFTFAFTKSQYPGPAGGVRPFGWYFKRKLDYEIQLDVQILEGLADQSTAIDGMKLSRFDRVLGLNRERIERIYRGQTPANHG
jgi:phenylpropionate dioxygenase-like ring-hydroxylating dioxygenase large terminal subunit